VDYSSAAEGSLGKGDIVIWSGTRGAFAGADIAITGITRDEEENAAFYEDDVDTEEILAGDASTDRADELRDALSG
jgi:lipid-binding SYLF domain-containing protein